MTFLVVWSIGFAIYGLGTWRLVEQVSDSSLMLFCTLFVSVFWPLFLLVSLVLGARRSPHEQ